VASWPGDYASPHACCVDVANQPDDHALPPALAVAEVMSRPVDYALPLAPVVAEVASWQGDYASPHACGAEVANQPAS
jgi:hypothetical protein